MKNNDIELTVESQNTDGQMVTLSEAEIRYAEEFADKINIMDKVMVLQYGTLPQKKVLSFSDSAIRTIPAADQNEIASIIRNLKRKQKEFITAFNRENLSVQDAKASEQFITIYNRFSAAVNEAARRLEILRSALLHHMSRLDDSCGKCMNFVREYDMYIYAGKKHLKDCRSNQLEKLLRKAERTGYLEDTIAADDYRQACDLFEKKLADLSLSRTLPVQMMTQIRLIQNADIAMTDSLLRLYTDTFTLYRNRIVLSLGLNKTGDSRNKIIDPDLFADANNDLLTALNAVLKVQDDGMEKQKKGIAFFGA